MDSAASDVMSSSVASSSYFFIINLFLNSGSDVFFFDQLPLLLEVVDDGLRRVVEDGEALADLGFVVVDTVDLGALQQPLDHRLVAAVEVDAAVARLDHGLEDGALLDFARVSVDEEAVAAG